MDTIYTIHKYLSIFNIYHIRQNISNRSSHQRCSLKKGFLEISQNLQENICARVSFLIKLEAFFSELHLPITNELLAKYLLRIFSAFYKHIAYDTTLRHCYHNSNILNIFSDIPNSLIDLHRHTP